jgi:hypothetical protein
MPDTPDIPKALARTADKVGPVVEAVKTIERLRKLHGKAKRLTKSFKRGQSFTIPPSEEPTTIFVPKGKAHLSFPAGVPVEWEGKARK